MSIYYQLCLDQSNLEAVIGLFCGAAAICTADQYYSCTTDLCTHRESHYLVITLQRINYDAHSQVFILIALLPRNRGAVEYQHVFFLISIP